MKKGARDWKEGAAGKERKDARRGCSSTLLIENKQ